MVGPFLLDVNVIVALIDENHVHHSVALHWFEEQGHTHWLTCPITEFGAVRIASGTNYPGGAWLISDVVESLHALQLLGQHQFVPHDLSLFGESPIIWRNVRSYKQVTDVHLLATAATVGAKLVTFDRRVAVNAVKDGADHLVILTHS